MPFIAGGVSLFFAFAIVQATSAAPIIKRAYLRYVLYLLFILTYFVVRESGINPVSERLEAILFCASVVSYMLFAKALFAEREAFVFLNDIRKLGIFAPALALQSLHSYAERYFARMEGSGGKSWRRPPLPTWSVLSSFP